MSSQYLLLYLPFAAWAAALMVFCAVRVRRALRTGRIYYRGGVEYDRRTSPVGFWVTLVHAVVMFFLFAAVGAAPVVAWRAWGAHG